MQTGTGTWLMEYEILLATVPEYGSNVVEL